MKIDVTKYTAMVANAAARIKVSSTVFKAFIADVKAVIDGNDDELIVHKAETVADGVHGMGSIAGQEYEEGVFTPTLRFGGGISGITYSVQTGRYRKIGKLVHYEINITLLSKGTSIGPATIAGLPLVSNTSVPTRAANIGIFQNISLPAGTIDLSLLLPASSATLSFFANRDNTSALSLADTNFTNTSNIQMEGTYQI